MLRISPLRRSLLGRLVLTGALVALALAGAQGATPAHAGGDPVLLAAGDVGICDAAGLLAGGAGSTAKLLNADPAATVAMLGDGAYDLSRSGSGSDAVAYQKCYDPTWGQAGIKGRTRPAPGDNEYQGSPQAADYFAYFNGGGPCSGPSSAPPACPAGPNGLGFYSYDLGAWHIVVLNAQCDPTQHGGLGNTALDGCGANNAEGRWLSADLAAHPTACTLAYWHEPRFYSFTSAGLNTPTNTKYDDDPTMDAMWQILQAHRADVVLNGHRHVYERFPKLVLPAPSGGGPGVADPVNGIREFVVGTGGGPHHHFDPDPRTDPTQTIYEPNSEVHIQQTFGVLRLTLHDGSYGWQFLDAATGKAVDAGSDTCHATPAATTTTMTSAPAVGPTTTTVGGGPSGLPGPAPQAGASGYWMVDTGGTVYPFGAAGGYGNAAPSPGATTAGLRPTPDGRGYWVVDSAGTVSARGTALPLGSVAPGALQAGESVTSLSPTPDGRGYWLFTNRGRVFTFGDAVSFGDMSHVRLNGPVLDSVPTPSGQGYYMVASDGGIFAFGDAVFAGSMGGRRLNAPVQSLVPLPAAGHTGYWLVASDGGVFAFNAPFRGSMGATHLSKPITGMVAYGDGYLMVGADGGIFDFSDRPFAGSLGAKPPAYPIISVAARP